MCVKSTVGTSKLSIERLKELLSYDPETGVFTWIGSDRLGYNGKIAGSPTSRGYVRINVDYTSYRAHILAWFYVHGEWPRRYLDHVNGNKEDNRIVNLRLASQSENIANSRISAANTSGFKGVSFDKKSGKYRAYVVKNYKQKALGYFDNPEEAHAAYVRESNKLFGEFARAS